MYLEKIIYSENQNKPNAWSFDVFELEPIVLVLGKNASGKTRTLNVIWNLAELVSGAIKFTYISGRYNAFFAHGNSKYEYLLEYENSEIVNEYLLVDGEKKLTRDDRGTCIVFAEEHKDNMKYKVNSNQLAVLAKRDELQHPALDTVCKWGEQTRMYKFGTKLGRETAGAFLEGGIRINERDPEAVVGLFKRGHKKFKKKFINAICKDMRSLGYNVEDVFLSPFLTTPNISVPLMMITVKESDLKGDVQQAQISQGMFRALSLLIGMNYILMAGSASLLLIDDIGEGLDYDRSVRLIELVQKKTKKNSLHIVMSTNDRFVMNCVTIESWAVISRTGSSCRFINYKNSKEQFDEFKYMGLSNFDFFRDELYLGENVS